MAKKDDTFTFTCDHIIEAIPDATLYSIKEDNGGYTKYIERHNNIYLKKHVTYKAIVGNIVMKQVDDSYYILTELTVNSISDDTIRDRLMYRIERKLL